MPVLIESPAKQTYKCYGIWLYKNNSQPIRALKKKLTPSVHGDRHWDSSYLLMDYFLHNPLKKKQRVLDVGCGWGPASIYLAKQGAQVTGLDVDTDVFAFLDLQANLNDVAIKTQQGAMASMKKSDLSKLDMIVGADICFWDELSVEWFALIKRAASAGVKKVIIADPGRSPFFDLAERCAKRWEIELDPWYALEPKRFEGHLLVVNLK